MRGAKKKDLREEYISLLGQLHGEGIKEFHPSHFILFKEIRDLKEKLNSMEINNCPWSSREFNIGSLGLLKMSGLTRSCQF